MIRNGDLPLGVKIVPEGMLVPWIEVREGNGETSRVRVIHPETGASHSYTVEPTTFDRDEALYNAIWELQRTASGERHIVLKQIRELEQKFEGKASA